MKCLSIAGNIRGEKKGPDQKLAMMQALQHFPTLTEGGPSELAELTHEQKNVNKLKLI